MSSLLQKRAVELAWRQWTALGVAGVAPLPEHAIDLEALIAFTPFVAAADPRLERECVDWCRRIGSSFVSVSRLRQLVRLMPATGERRGDDIAKLLMDGPRQRAAPFALSNKSRPPRLHHPSLIQLRSRYIFGVGARADVIVALVMRPRDANHARISEIRPAGYTKPTIATVLDELTEAGVLEELVVSRAATYKLVKGAPLRSLLSPLPRRSPSWPERFVLVANVLEAWRQFGNRSSYPIELAKVLHKLRPVAAAIQEKPPIIGRPATIVADVERWSSRFLDP